MPTVVLESGKGLPFPMTTGDRTLRFGGPLRRRKVDARLRAK